MKRLSYYLMTAVTVAAVLWTGLASADYGRFGRNDSPRGLTERQKTMLQKRGLGGIKAEGTPEILDISRTTSAEQGRNGLTTRSSIDPVGEFFMVAPVSVLSSYSGFYASLNATTGNVRPIYQGSTYCISDLDYDCQSGVVVNGILYIPAVPVNMVTEEFQIEWRRVDLSTGKVLSPLNFGTDSRYFCYSMTYDPKRNVIFGLSVNYITGKGGNLVRINCEGDPSEWKLVADGNGIVFEKDLGGSDNDWMASICYNPIDGLIYCLKGSEGVFYSYDPDKDELVKVYEFDPLNDHYCFYRKLNPPAPICYSPRDKAFVGLYKNGNREQIEVFTIDAETFQTSHISDLSLICFPSSIFCYDEYADALAPDQVSELKVNLNGTELSGNVNLTMPSTNFDGVAYESGKTLDLVLSLDGEQVYKNSHPAGEKVSVPLSFTAGAHELVAKAMDGDLMGAPLTVKFYAGYDIPLAPKDLFLEEDGTLMWEAPSVRNGGVNGGAVNVDDLTYNVYNGNEKLNNEPIVGTRFKIPEPAKLTRYNLTVTALNHGSESAPSATLSRMIGAPLALPQFFEPTKEDAATFDTVDLDGKGHGDFNAFKFSTYGGFNSMRIVKDVLQRYDAVINDYLILPKMNFEDKNKQYSFSFRMDDPFTTGEDDSSLVSFDVILRSHHDGSSDDKVIYSIVGEGHRANPDHNVRFTVPEAGGYYLVIYMKCDNSNPSNYWGGRISNMRVEEITGATTLAPSELTDLSVKAAEKGALNATISFKAPLTDINGDALDSNDEITVEAKTGENSATAKVRPGASGSVTINVSGNGMHEFTLIPSNKNGEGIPQSLTGYVGIDTPLPPIEVTHSVSDDNMSMRLEWNAPTEGVNGGYVDPEALKYNIWRKVSATPTVIGTTDKLFYDFTATESAQAYYEVGPSAISAAGESHGIMYASESLGRPYELPMTETFPFTGFNYGKWMYSRDGEFTSVEWDSANSFDGLGIGNPVINAGCLYAYNTISGSGSGQLKAPKFTTKGITNAKISVKYWDSPYAADMEFWVRTNKDQTLRKVASCKPTRLITEWKYFEYELEPELLDCGWVQINLRTYHKDMDALCIIDNYTVIQNVHNDFKVQEVKGPEYNIVGDEPEFTVVALNSGLEPGRTNVYLELLADGKVVDSKTIKTPNTPVGTSYELKGKFRMNPDYLGKELVVRGRVESDDDEIENNNIREIPVNLQRSIFPIVDDLQGEWSSDEHSSVNFTWSTPETSFGNADSFEGVLVGGNHETLGQWKNYDLDGLKPFLVAGNSGVGQPLEWEGSADESGWQAINADDLELQFGERIYPHSGKQCLLARSAAFTEEQDPKPVADWLVSPEIVGGTKVSFWMNTISSQYTETITVFYSTGSNEIPLEGGMDNLVKTGTSDYVCGDFKSLAHFSKSGAEDWEKITFTLPADAKYFALVYRSIGMFGALIDDIEFTPKKEANWNIDSFTLFEVDDRGNRKIVKDQIKGNSFTYPSKDVTKMYAISPVCYDDNDNYFESPLSNIVMILGTGVDGVFDENSYVAGGKGMIIVNGLEGKNISVFTADGRMTANVKADSDHYVIPAEAGIYMVQVGKQTAKILVK